MKNARLEKAAERNQKLSALYQKPRAGAAKDGGHKKKSIFIRRSVTTDDDEDERKAWAALERGASEREQAHALKPWRDSRRSS